MNFSANVVGSVTDAQTDRLRFAQSVEEFRSVKGAGYILVVKAANIESAYVVVEELFNDDYVIDDLQPTEQPSSGIKVCFTVTKPDFLDTGQAQRLIEQALGLTFDGSGSLGSVTDITFPT